MGLVGFIGFRAFRVDYRVYRACRVYGAYSAGLIGFRVSASFSKESGMIMWVIGFRA